jgi:DNA-directed RNA polymerase specialized sigma subunit
MILEVNEYTFWQGRKSFMDERKMIEEAHASDDGFKRLKKYLIPLVDHWVDDHMEQHPDSNVSRGDLAQAGFAYLQFAVKRYYPKAEKRKVGYKFSSFYEWFIRHGINEYARMRY